MRMAMGGKVTEQDAMVVVVPESVLEELAALSVSQRGPQFDTEDFKAQHGWC